MGGLTGVDDGDALAHSLLAAPWEIEAAFDRSSGIPATSGLYAWWGRRPDILPGIELEPVVGRAEFLLYIGISPKGPSSRQDLRRRLRTHVRGNIGASTFRFTLTALLWEQQGWTPIQPGD